MDDTGHARIGDYGLAVVIQGLDFEEGADLRRGHTARWTAPEVLDEKPYSKEADVFSFAMLTIEVCHGRYPRVELLLTTIPYLCRYSPARFLLAVAHPSWLSHV